MVSNLTKRDLFLVPAVFLIILTYTKGQTSDSEFENLYQKLDQAYQDYDYKTILENDEIIVSATRNRTDTSAANSLGRSIAC